MRYPRGHRPPGFLLLQGSHFADGTVKPYCYFFKFKLYQCILCIPSLSQTEAYLSLFFFFKPMSVEISEKCFTCSTKFQSSITRLTSVELNTEIPISAGRGPGQPYPQGKFRGILEAQTFVKTCFKIYVNTILMYKS